RGTVSNVRMPRSWLARIQVLEYLRAFLLGRIGWSRVRAIVIISGAFGLFSREVVIEVGGFDPDSVGEDADLVASIHQKMRSLKRDYRVVFVSDPVSWTEVPETLRVLG